MFILPHLKGLTAGNIGSAAFKSASLDLKFADNKSLTDAITGSNLVTFTRSSRGTYVDSEGVIRTAVTNLLLRSEEFDNASWNKNNSTVSANSAAAPDGMLTADKLVEAATTSAHSVFSNFAATGAVPATLSVYAKAAERSEVALQIFEGASLGTAVFDLVSGTIASGSGLITPAGNGWYRCSTTVTPPTGTSVRAFIITALGGGISYTGDGTSGIYLWGAQLEQSATVGEYIPTTSTINSAPRFDHNPTTGESLGLLVEEQRTNLVLRSEEFDNASWTKTSTTVSANSTAAPNGATSADLLIPGNGISPGSAQVFQDSTVSASTAYTFSVYLKQGGQTSARFGITIRTAASAYIGNVYYSINLVSGSVALVVSAGTPPTSVAASAISLPNQWWKVTFTATTTGTTGIIRSSWLSDAIGNGTSGIYIWGAQLEAGAFPTSYIKTEAAAATRSADVASITGSAFSGWYRQDEGTVFVRAATFSTGTALTHAISDGTFNESIYANFSGGTGFRGSNVLDAGVPQAVGISTFTGLVASDGVNDALAFQANNFGESLNGLATRTDNTGTIPTVDRLFIGSSWAGTSSFLNGTIKRLTYWPTRLGNSTLQSITS